MLVRLRRYWLVGSLWALACSDRAAPSAPSAPQAPAKPSEQELLAQVRQAQFEHAFPLHGLVTGLQLKVHKTPDGNGTTVGWLRAGARIRLGAAAMPTADCQRGFYQVAPVGYACASEGILVADQPPPSSIVVAQPQTRAAALPYDYYYVKEPATAEYHRLPSRDEQRAVATFTARYLQLQAKDAKKAERLMAGELKNEPARLEIVRRFIDRGFFIASTGIETRNARQFVRTVRGSFVKLTDLDARKGNGFHGVVLDNVRKLPIAWAVRAAQSFVPTLDDAGTPRLVSDETARSYDRLARVPWVKREHVGDQLFHRLEDGHYLKAWYVAVAEPIARPKEIKTNEPWVHENLDQQTLVAYRGDMPVYATLVATGVQDHPTKPGLYEIRSKHVSTSMSDIGPDVSADLRYSIDDVPWTQYFSGSIALHAAFWHAGYGLPHSHGCVNLAPLDAHWLFDHTLPELSAGWHGVATDGSGLHGSKVLITEK
jgi:hypothetical protein